MSYQFMTPQKARIVALHYLKTGNKRDSMLAADFPPEYVSTSKSYSMFRGKKVQDAIEELEVAAKGLCGDVTLEVVIDGFKAMAWPAEGVNVSNADKNYALDKLAKIKAGYVDRVLIGRDAEQPTPVSAEDVELFRSMARAATRMKLSEPGALPVGQAVGPVLEARNVTDVSRNVTDEQGNR